MLIRTHARSLALRILWNLREFNHNFSHKLLYHHTSCPTWEEPCTKILIQKINLIFFIFPRSRITIFNKIIKTAHTLINITRFYSKASTDTNLEYSNLIIIPPVALAMRFRSTFLHLLTAIAPASTKYLRQRSSIPPVVNITLAPEAKIFCILSLVISASLENHKREIK